MHGGGTEDNPYVVDSWDDYMSLVNADDINIEGKYVEFEPNS